MVDDAPTGVVRWIGVARERSAVRVSGRSAYRKKPHDTVVTRREHTLVTKGHTAGAPSVLRCRCAVGEANALVAANWFLLAGGILTLGLIVLRTKERKSV